MTLKCSDLGNIVSPPGQVSSLHSKIVTELRAAAGNSLQQSGEAPALVTSVNTSRVVADIKRDLSRVTGLTFCNCGGDGGWWVLGLYKQPRKQIVTLS